MNPPRTNKNKHYLRCLIILAFLISLSACIPGVNNSIEGKWEATIVSKRSGQSGKVIYEFLPDGTFHAFPPGDTALVDKDKYKLLDDGHTLDIRSQLLGNDAVCKFTGSAIQCEAEDTLVNFKRL